MATLPSVPETDLEDITVTIEKNNNKKDLCMYPLMAHEFSISSLMKKFHNIEEKKFRLKKT